MSIILRLPPARMKFFIDSAFIDDIRPCLETGLIDGVTTNPSLFARCTGAIKDIVQELCTLVPGPVSVEVTHSTQEGMLDQGRMLAALAPNVVVKVPLTPDGLKVCRSLHQEGIPVNVTLCFSVGQALLAAKAGATYFSPFIGRIDDTGHEGIQLLEDIRYVYDRYAEFSTAILAASIRHPYHVAQAARAGADVVTLPPAIFHHLYTHPLTQQGLDIFARDWQKTSGF